VPHPELRIVHRLRLRSPPLVYLVRVALLAGVYYGAARLGLHYASIGQSISLVWPPTGIAFAAITLWGYRYWPGVALGAFLANAVTPVHPLAAAGIALGNTIEALGAAYFLRRTAGSRPDLNSLLHVRTLVMVAAPLGALCSAVIGTVTLWIAGALDATALPSAAAVWWTGDVLGALVVAPVFFAWAVPAAPDHNTRRLIEVLVLYLGTITVAEIGLGQLVASGFLRQLNYHYLLFPFVIWAALRFGARGASVMTLTISAVAIGHTIQGGGPFVSASAVRTLFQVAGYLAVVAVTGLVLAAAVRWERLQATRTLAESQERLRRALDAARMGIWVWSTERNVLSWDENLRQLYGLSPNERVSGYEDFLARVHPDDRLAVQETIRKALEDGGDLDYEFRIVLPDGQVRWIGDHGEVRRDDQGNPVYLTGICTDMTERRIAEERLRQAHRMESVGRLAGGVAHETNNQMSVVLGAANFILDRPDVPEAVRADVEFMRKAAERTAAITAQLLAFSRRQILKAELLDLHQVVKEWEPVLRRIMGEDCGVTLRLSTDPCLVKADRGQLEQVLLNLALNARDAMPRGGGLSVETSRGEFSTEQARSKPARQRPGYYAMLAVSDTGHGMDQETQNHVFEPFFTTKGVGQGTGLGLSTVYGIVKQSDGYIWVYSEPGIGTTFKIYLPLHSGRVGIANPRSGPVRSRAGERVLLVEDEPLVRYMMKRALEEAGYGVIEAADAAEALEIARAMTEKVSLLLTDVIMPRMGGRELATRIRELIPGIRVLFTSGYTDGDIAQRGLLEPDASFIQKPVAPAALVQAVRDEIERNIGT
jgi:PAS domain S-box-containing protein